MMSVEEVLQNLELLGSEQARKTYRRHGVKGPVFGVSYADQGKLAKKLKSNPELAPGLWASGNHDARVLALSIGDAQQTTGEQVDEWMSDLSDYVISDGLSGYIGRTALARENMDAWMCSTDEWRGTVGWNVLASLAINDQALPDAFFEPYLSNIERDIHGSKNRTRYAMNNALIAIGMRNEALEMRAIDAATRIGKVIVDPGEANCNQRDAWTYLHQANERDAPRV